jgi:tellurite resistance protein TerC
VLVFVGAKMLLLDVYKMPAAASLVVITALLGVAIAASLLADRRRATVVRGELSLPPPGRE